MRCIVLILMLSVFVVSCSVHSADNGGFSVEMVNDSLYNLVLETDSSRDVWELRFPVYRFCTGDMDGDSIVDAVVGVEKPTRFDPVVRKRVFMFHNVKGKVRPLWMGSRLGQPIVDFRVVQVDHETRLRSVEEEQNGKFLVAEYKWGSFGVEFIRYLCRDFGFDDSMEILNDK
ncbi:MAG: hypothetical protein J6W06_04625 [Bacteroidales bacterium]|nr:hypothetical protein [Bacteroidales bacterium]